MDNKPEKKLLVIGNGYDLYLHYPFTYQDFFKFRYYKYLDSESKPTVEIKEFLNNSLTLLGEIKRRKQEAVQTLDSEITKMRQRHALAIHFDSIMLHPLQVLDIIFYYPKVIENLTDVQAYLEIPQINWSDIESVIGICSLTLDDCLKNPNSQNFLTKNSFKEKFELICNLVMVLNSGPREQLENINNLIGKDRTIPELQEELRQSITTIEKSFRDYLVEKYKSADESTTGYPKRDHQNYINKAILNDPANTTVLSFNYTDIDSTAEIIHPHGSIHEQNIIFGINSTIHDKLIDSNSSSFQLTKTFRGLLNQTLQSPTKTVLLPKIIKELVFFGHSLNTSDYDYFYSLFDYYNLYDSDLKLTFYYALFDNADPDNAGGYIIDIIKRRDEQIQKVDVTPVTKLIDSYGESIRTSEHGNNLLHRLLLEHRISIVNIEPDPY